MKTNSGQMISHLFSSPLLTLLPPSHFPTVPFPSGLFSFLLPGSVQGPEASLPDAAFVKLKYFQFEHWSEPLLYQADSANTCL